MSNITIHLFRISSASKRDLAALLARIEKTSKHLRFKRVGNAPVGLQDSRKIDEQGIHLLDFVRKRSVGPGKVPITGDIESFNFAPGEEYGEETAALYDPARGWLLVEFNQHGARAGSICDYFNAYDADPESDWVVEPQLDDETETRLRRKKTISMATIKVRLTHSVTDALRASGEALGQALESYGRESLADVVEITVKRRDKTLGLSEKAFKLVRDLASMGQSDEGVQRLEVTGREVAEGNDETINLLKHRIKHKYSADHLEIVGNRYTQDSRWRALMGVRAGWINQLDDL